MAAAGAWGPTGSNGLRDGGSSDDRRHAPGMDDLSPNGPSSGRLDRGCHSRGCASRPLHARARGLYRPYARGRSGSGSGESGGCDAGHQDHRGIESFRVRRRSSTHARVPDSGDRVRGGYARLASARSRVFAARTRFGPGRRSGWNRACRVRATLPEPNLRCRTRSPSLLHCRDPIALRCLLPCSSRLGCSKRTPIPWHDGARRRMP